jgi:hypothetical protein
VTCDNRKKYVHHMTARESNSSDNASAAPCIAAQKHEHSDKKKKTFEKQNHAKSKDTFMLALLPTLHGRLNFAFHSVFAPLLILDEVL